MMAEGYPACRRHIVAPVVEPDGGSRNRIIEFQDSPCDECGIEAITDRIDADRRNDKPQRVDPCLAAYGRDYRKTIRADRGDRRPSDITKPLHTNFLASFCRRVPNRKASRTSH